ncbi:TRAP transporter small permease [Marinihelvus fidelis]|uniref:TRAP transporter small permease protein n=1 Tax=Marinihelvus fidelis TaxID=2613842 RepID=A0A5N0TJ39_9GAMM|nr:TRAP transporter small permease [Marinihelvus fidelis]KAA9134117.1 TRAP transporter small permease [Marinihelvus fidelis]
MKLLTPLADGLEAVLKHVLVALMVALVGAVSWQVISRYVFSAPSSWTEEVARFLLIWVSLLGAAYSTRHRAHLGLDLLAQKVTGKAEAWLHGFTAFVIVLFALGVLVVGGGKLVALTWELKQTSAVLGIPVAIVYSVIPLTGALITLFALSPASGATTTDPVLGGES